MLGFSKYCSVQKYRSCFLGGLYSLQSYFRCLMMRLFYSKISSGKRLRLGKNVQIRTVPPGKIKLGDNISIEAGAYIFSDCGTIEIGDNVFIGRGVEIVSSESIQIGNDTLIAAYSVIRDSQHICRSGAKIRLQGREKKKVVIGSDVWLGSHSVVMPGCHLAVGSVVGANAVVTKNTVANSVSVGVPAKKIKMRI